MKTGWFLALLAGPAVSVVLAAAPPDWSRPAFQEIRRAWQTETNALEGARRLAYQEMLERRQTEMEAELRDKSAVRNVTGMAVARRALEICREGLESVRTNGTFHLPGSIRRELTEWLQKLAAEKAAADARTDESLAQARARFKTRLAETLVRETGQPAPSDPELDRIFDALLAAAPAPFQPSRPDEKSPAASSQPQEATSSAPLYFAASGEAENWRTAGRWMADVMARDVFSIPILAVTSSYQGAQHPPIGGDPTPYSYEMVEPIPADAGVVRLYRLKRLPGREPVEVMAWPSLQNRGRLEFRTQPVTTIPSPHGFELETAVAGQREGGRGIEARVASRPPGAEIQINGRAASGPDGGPLRTPAQFQILPGTYRLTLSLPNHVAQTLTNWNPQTTPSVALVLPHETNLPPTKVIRMDPTRPWISSDLVVRPGDRLWVLPEGFWVIGARGERCGPEGYPHTAAFAHYYQSVPDPRQSLAHPYGALLIRFGPFEDPIAVTNARLFRVSLQGVPTLDVNERSDKDLRRNNRGSMTVRLIHVPFTP
jgi:hypothetical protein